MIIIHNEPHFTRAMQADRCIVVLHAKWSMPSVAAIKIVEQWEQDWKVRDPPATVPLYLVQTDNDYPAHVVAWLESQALDRLATSGYGEVLWLARGRVVEKLYFKHSVAALNAGTQALLKHP